MTVYNMVYNMEVFGYYVLTSNGHCIVRVFPNNYSSSIAQETKLVRAVALYLLLLRITLVVILSVIIPHILILQRRLSYCQTTLSALQNRRYRPL